MQLLLDGVGSFLPSPLDVQSQALDASNDEAPVQLSPSSEGTLPSHLENAIFQEATLKMSPMMKHEFSYPHPVTVKPRCPFRPRQLNTRTDYQGMPVTEGSLDGQKYFGGKKPYWSSRCTGYEVCRLSRSDCTLLTHFTTIKQSSKRHLLLGHFFQATFIRSCAAAAAGPLVLFGTFQHF